MNYTYLPAHDHQIPPVDLLVPTNESDISMMTEFQHNKASLVVTNEANFWESFQFHGWDVACRENTYKYVCLNDSHYNLFCLLENNV
jgi:hypothetical protein